VNDDDDEGECSTDLEGGGSGTEDSGSWADWFTPSEEWLRELKATLPLETTTQFLQHLVPVVDELCAHKNGVVDEV